MSKVVREPVAKYPDYVALLIESLSDVRKSMFLAYQNPSAWRAYLKSVEFLFDILPNDVKEEFLKLATNGVDMDTFVEEEYGRCIDEHFDELKHPLVYIDRCDRYILRVVDRLRKMLFIVMDKHGLFFRTRLIEVGEEHG